MPKKTFEIAIETGNDLLVQVKANQEQLLQDCIDTHRFNKETETHTTEDKAHGRIEKRTTVVHRTVEWINDGKWKALIAAIIIVFRIRTVYNTKTKKWEACEETSWYVCNKTEYTAKQFHDAIRNHWGIENSNHYVKDTAMGEDHSKIRKKACIMATIRSFALNILRANHVENVKQALYKNALNFNRIRKYKAIFD